MAEAQAAANKAAQKSAASTAPAKESAKKATGDEAAADESGLTQNHISMVMEHTGCTRNEAIGALRETNDDMVNAVLKLTKWAGRLPIWNLQPPYPKTTNSPKPHV